MFPSSCLDVNLLTGVRTQALASLMIAVLNGMPESVKIEFIYSHPNVIARIDSNLHKSTDIV